MGERKAKEKGKKERRIIRNNLMRKSKKGKEEIT